MAIDRSTARRLTLAVDHGLAYEALLALAAVRGEVPAERLQEGERLRAAYGALPAATRREIEAVDAGFGFNWSDLVGLVRSAPAPRGVPELVAHLRSLDPLDAKLAMLGWHDPELRRQVGADVYRSAAAAEPGGVRRFRAQVQAAGRPRPGPLVSLPAPAAIERAVKVLESIPPDFYLPTPDLEKLLATAAVNAASVGTRVAPTAAVESVTRGLVYRDEAGVEELLLVPASSFRPWTVILDHERTKIFCFPVWPPAPSGGAPPAGLVAVHRALGDDTRLLLLKRLAAGRATFSQLSRDLGLARSTVHHHELILRTAGLVRLHLGADGGLELNPEPPELDRPLRAYLENPADS